MKRWIPWTAAALLAAGAGAALLLGGRPGTGAGESPGAAAAAEAELARIRAKEPAIRDMCSKCHFWPPPDVLPKHLWGKKVLKMFDLANRLLLETRQRPLKEMKPEEVIEFYETLAPQRLATPPWTARERKPGMRFETKVLRTAPATRSPAGAAGVQLEYVFEDLPGPEILVSDMFSGVLSWGRPGEPDRPLEAVARLRNPDRARAVDLDGDGARDLLVSDLGNASSVDDACGSVEWLRRTGPRSFEAIRLLEGVGRVADARAADLDGDGDLDLVVAAFGWYTSGRTILLWNRGPGPGGRPRFEEETLDERNGSTAVPILDLDGDGRLDVVILISQENECIYAYMNLGEGKFREEKVFAAPHPHFGGDGMDVADIDGDGDLDIVLANGDTMDDMVQFKPWQGVTILENRGSFPFEVRFLGPYYGAHQARIVDFDGDGDRDVVACSFLPRCDPEEAARMGVPGAVWYEQTSPGAFLARPLQDGPPEYPAMEVADLDGDGLLDLLLGVMHIEDSRAEERPALVRALFRR